MNQWENFWQYLSKTELDLRNPVSWENKSIKKLLMRNLLVVFNENCLRYIYIHIYIIEDKMQILCKQITLWYYKLKVYYLKFNVDHKIIGQK